MLQYGISQTVSLQKQILSMILKELLSKVEFDDICHIN